MSVKLVQYTNQQGFTDDFYRVRDFLVRINIDNVTTPHFLWGRWEWAFSLPYLDTNNLSKIGIWEDNGKIVALCTYEQGLGYAYFCIDKGYNFLKEEMLLYAKENLSKDGVLKALISDNDREFQRIALSRGFKPTQSKEDNAVFDINANSIKYVLPHGYRISSLADSCDLYKFNRVLWRGFNHEGEPPTTAEQIEDRRISLSGPHLNLNFCVVVISPEDEYVSYCGMWYDKKTNNALVEPVATDPLHRRKGLGKAAVLEAIKRCGMEGAKHAYVGSSQQFYYQIGFSPIPSDTFWECG